MAEALSLPIERLHRRADARPLNDDVLAALSESIEEIGLVNPIRVREASDGYEVIAGAHRFAACDLLGHGEIACILVDDDDLHAELAMIDENLMRAELSPADRAQQTARRKAIYLELHPETALGENQHTRVRQVGEGSEAADRFTAETAKISGSSERTVQRDAERGEKVVDAAIDTIRGTRLDTGTYLDKLKRMPPDEQVAAAKRDLEEPRSPRPTATAGRYVQNASVVAQPTKAFDRFIGLVDEIEALSVSELIVAAGKRKSVLGQRASGLADRMTEIMEVLDR